MIADIGERSLLSGGASDVQHAPARRGERNTMKEQVPADASRHGRVVPAFGETPIFRPGEQVRVAERFPLGHYRVPLYLRGKAGVVERLVQPAVDNEEEGFGRNAGMRRHYYRVAFPMTEVWREYAGARQDRLYIEVFETWLEPVRHG